MKYTHLPLVALRAFEAAGRLGTMTAASEELCVTPGAVSRQIRQLETLLGVPLFSGSKNKPVLTEQGLSLLPILTSAMSQMLAGIHAIQSTERNIINVSCLNTFAIRCLIPRLYLFNTLYPDIDVRLSTTSVEHFDKSYDVIIGVTNEPVGQGGDKRLLFSETIGPVISPELIDRYSVKTPEDLQAVPMLQSRTRLDAWSAWCSMMEKTVDRRDAVKFDHLYFALEAVLGGLGFCVAPLHLVAGDIASCRLSAPFGFVDSGYHYVVSQVDSHHHNAAKFVAWLEEQCYG